MSEHRAHLDLLPPHMHAAICLWLEDPPHPTRLGSFLHALLANDLKNAFLTADDKNAAAMRNWVMFLYHHTPGPCWGSPLKLEEWWLAHHEAKKARVGAT